MSLVLYSPDFWEQAEGVAPVANVAPSLDSKKQTTRYRDGKVVTTTGAKVRIRAVRLSD